MTPQLEVAGNDQVNEVETSLGKGQDLLLQRLEMIETVLVDHLQDLGDSLSQCAIKWEKCQ